ncbi:metallophosphoesterase family protein [soil metagenome]
MIRRLTVKWPNSPANPVPSAGVRLLAVSDEREAALGHARNRSAIAPVSVIVGCGDLEPDYLSFLGDAFHAPLLYVHGNHDRGGAWEAGLQVAPMPLGGRVERAAGVTFGGLGWPSRPDGRAERDEGSAWRQALALYLRARLRGPQPAVILSHVPPRDLGDDPSDPYHTGFAAYRWLCQRLQPVLWLHGHTTLAAARHWRCQLGRTTLVNVTGAALIELDPTARSLAPGAGRGQ